MPNFMGFLHRKLIILPECLGNDENVFLGSEGFYLSQKSQLGVFRVLKIPPYQAKSGGKMPNFMVFLHKKPINILNFA